MSLGRENTHKRGSAERDLRFTTLALAAAGLVAVGSAACSVEEVVEAGASAASEQTDDNGSTDAPTLSGELEFVAPGELMVDGQAFFVAEDTRILGGVSACPADGGVDENGRGNAECDLEVLEGVLQEGTPVFADVVTGEEGNAESITEFDPDHAGAAPGDGAEEAPEDGAEGVEGDGGFTGTAEGALEYVAPGEFIIDDTAFYVSEDTLITAGMYACADGVQDPDTGNVTCDFDEFDTTLANGTPVFASVEIVDGIAETITEV